MNKNFSSVESNTEYKSLVKKHAPRSPILKNATLAFLIGGLISFVGEWLSCLYRYLGVDLERSYLLVTVTYIILASLATGFGFFDKIARHGGAGTLLPVTGFSNAVTSAAIDTRSEGYIAGVGSKIFTVAGPVILYSTLTGTLYGLIYYIYKTVSML